MEITIPAFKAETFFTLQGDLRHRAIRLFVTLSSLTYRAVNNTPAFYSN